jgi:hypothetical protein
MNTRDTQTVSETGENCSQPSTSTLPSNIASLCKIKLESQEHSLQSDQPSHFSQQSIPDLSLAIKNAPKASSQATSQQNEMKTEVNVQINQRSVDSSLASNPLSFMPSSTSTKSRKRKRKSNKNETNEMTLKNENPFMVTFLLE